MAVFCINCKAALSNLDFVQACSYVGYERTLFVAQKFFDVTLIDQLLVKETVFTYIILIVSD